QMNLRTYVTHKKSAERGVYFLTIYTDSLISAIGAKRFFYLPFQLENLSINPKHSIRVRHQTDTIFSATFEPQMISIKNELSTFLTERYCIWNIKSEKIIKIPILHKKWSLQQIKVQVNKQDLLPFAEPLDFPPFICHYSPFKQTVLFPYE